MKTGRCSARAIVAALAFSAVLSGCVGSAFTIPTVTDQPIDYSQGRQLTSSACGFQLLLLLPIMTTDTAERAFEGLRKQAGPDAYIADVEISERWAYAFVGTVYCTDLTAMAYAKRAATPAQAPVPSPDGAKPEGVKP